ncbi:DUF4839 domain-containing protein [Streptomyces sp. JNUCC 63]
MADEIKYEYKTVRTVRGTDGLVISKMQKDGWELVEQAQGALRSTLDFRRPKKPQPWLLIGAAAAVLVILAIVIGVASALSDGGEKKGESGKSAAAASEKTSAAPTPTAAKSAATEVITPQNNPEFAALLKTPDYCDEANLDFATRHKGQTIAFNGSIVNMAPHGDYKTRYDFLLGPGDKGPQTTVGPAFKYEDINILNLNLTGKKIPATIGEGDKFRFVAEVGEFNAVQCLFFLDPISTEVR